jgi:mannose-1-phosphate guanylyltransferase/mannose-6-phosphate isomerase
MKSTLLPVILAGGSGTRLWPLSRKNFPKQFLCLQGQRSLLQQTLDRVALLKAEKAIVVSNDAHYFLCQEQLRSSYPSLTYLLEPCPRNTAPAIATTAYYIQLQYGSDALMLILPSDHWIKDDEVWSKNMLEGAVLAERESAIVTFGIQPNSPKTGYGYIEAGKMLSKRAYKVARFKEKPSEIEAKRMVEQGTYFWNSGMFVCKVGVYLQELQRFAPTIAIKSKEAFDKAYQHHDFHRLDLQTFSTCPSESIDYAIMEHTDKAVLVPINPGWSDLGCWSSVAESNALNEEGNALTGNVISQNSQNCFISSEKILVTALGLRDQIIVATEDAVLVADKRYSEQVKELVNQLQENFSEQVDDHVRVTRPWGYYEVLAQGESFKVKRLMVKPGAKLSLQQHQHRAEHWVVVEGEAEVINGDKSILLKTNQSTYIPQKTKHRLSNPGNLPLYVIEVQSGSYLKEDDIQRFDDVYERNIVS